MGRKRKSESAKSLEREWKKRQKAYNSFWGKYIERQLRKRGFKLRLGWNRFFQLWSLVRGCRDYDYGKKKLKPYLDAYGLVPFYKEYKYIYAIRNPPDAIKTLKPIKLKK